MRIPHARYLVIDDHPLVVRAVAHILGEQESCTVTGAASLHEVRTLFQLGPQFDLILLDRYLGDVDTFRFLGELRAISGGTPVVMLSGDASAESVAMAARLGAAGYIVKTDATEQILGTVRAVRAGGCSFPHGARAAEPAGGRDPEQHEAFGSAQGMTRREIEVLQLLVVGDRNKEIARKLELSPVTVKGYVSQILKKLRAVNRAQAVAKTLSALRQP